MEKLDLIRELNKLKGFRRTDALCIDRHRAFKGNDPGTENLFLPEPKEEINEQEVGQLAAMYGQLEIPVQPADISYFKGDPRLSKTPARSKAQAVNDLVGGWWKNSGR